MHEEKLYTSYFEGVLRCNRISNVFSGLKEKTLLEKRMQFLETKKATHDWIAFLILDTINLEFTSIPYCLIYFL